MFYYIEYYIVLSIVFSFVGKSSGPEQVKQSRPNKLAVKETKKPSVASPTVCVFFTQLFLIVVFKLLLISLIVPFQLYLDLRI